MGKVCKVKVCKVDDLGRGILQNLYLNREGLRVPTIMKLINSKQRTIYKRLNDLRDKGLVENLFPLWKIVNGQVKFVQTLLESNNIFELHNLSYVLKLIKTPEWWNRRKPVLRRLKGWDFSNHNFGKNNSNPYQQLINENFVIQTYPESIIIISRKRYYSNNPYETITEAINDVLNIIDYLEERFKFKLFPSQIPALEIRGNDFNRLSDHLAEHCKKDGRRFLVELDKHRKVWVDYSEPFGKEANYPEGQEILEKVTKDYLLNKPKLNSQLQSDIERIENQLLINKRDSLKQDQELSESNMDLRLVMKQMDSNIKGLTETVYQLIEVIKHDRSKRD